MKAKEPILKAYEQSPHFNLSFEEIGTYIDELYMPYTLTFKKHEEYLNYRKKLPRYSYPDKRNGAGETGRNVDGIIYVIPEPKEDETEKIEKFILIEDKRKKLVEIKRLQVQLFSKSTERKGLECYKEIKNRIEILFKDILDIDKPEEEILNKEKEKDEKVPPHWHAIAPFLISGQINKLQQNGYGNLEAKDFTKIVLKEYKIPLTVGQIRPYLQSTLFTSNSTAKDLYSKSKIIALIKFSKDNNLEIKDNNLLRKIKEYNLEY